MEIRREKVKYMISINDSNAARKVVNLSKEIKMDYNDYFLGLMRRYFPVSIKEYNLLSFIEYNLKLIFHNINIQRKGALVIINIKINKQVYSFRTMVE